MNNKQLSLSPDELRQLACRKPKKVRKSHGPAAYFTVRWLRRHPKVSDRKLLVHFERDVDLFGLEQGFRHAGLPDPVSLDDPYTRWGRRWHRRRLAKTLLDCGFEPDSLWRLTRIDHDARFDQHTKLSETAANLVVTAKHIKTATPSGALCEDAEHVAWLVQDQLDVPASQQRTMYGWLCRFARVEQLVHTTLEPYANGDGFKHLNLADRARLAMSGLFEELDSELQPAAAVILSNRALARRTKQPTGQLSAKDLSLAKNAACELNGDVVRARLIGRRSKPSRSAVVKSRPRDAVVKWGELSDVAYAQLHTTRYAGYADDIALMFTTARVPVEQAAGQIRGLSPKALDALLGDNVVPSRETVESAVRIACTFKRRTKALVDAVNAASRRHGVPVPSTKQLGVWLPVSGDLDGFAGWLLANQRAQATLTEAGCSQLASIAANFSELDSSEQSLTVKETASKLRLRGYGPIGETAFGVVCADAGISASVANAHVDRWRESLSTPQLFPTKVRFQDEKSKLSGRFLPREDPRGLWLGHLTDCCQYPGSVGAVCAWAGCENPLHGFFVVEDTERTVVAQSWVWSDGKGGACFDSVERRDRSVSLTRRTSKAARNRARGIRRLYRQAGEHLLGWFQEVHVGPAWGLGKLTATKANTSFTPHGYDGYRDSRQQFLLAAREKDAVSFTVRAIADGYTLWENGKKLAEVTPAGVSSPARIGQNRAATEFERFGHDLRQFGLEPSTPKDCTPVE